MLRLDVLGLMSSALLVTAVVSERAPAAPAPAATPTLAAPQDPGAPLVHELTGNALDPRMTKAAVQEFCNEFLAGRFDKDGGRRLGIPVADVRDRFGTPHFDVGADRPLWVYRMTDGSVIAMQTCDLGKYVLNVYAVEHEPAVGATGLAALGALESMLCFWGC